MRVYDLSPVIENKMTVYPKDPKVVVQPHRSFKNNGYNILSLHLSSHTGAHVDGPSHLIEDGVSMDKLPLEGFTGMAMFAEILKKENDIITGKNIETLDMQGSDILIIGTGWENRIKQKDYCYNFPFFNEDAAEALIMKNIKAIGTDTVSQDGCEGRVQKCIKSFCQNTSPSGKAL